MDIDYKDLTEKELYDIRDDAFKELERRQAIANTKQQVDELVSTYIELTQDDSALTSIPSGGVAPGQRIKAKDGRVYYNDTTTWLPVGPDDYLMGYRLVDTPAPTTVKPWLPDEYVRVGDTRNYKNQVYSVLQPHNTQTGWEPDKTPALWTLL